MDSKLKNLFSSLTRSLGGGKLNLGNLAGKAASKLQSKTSTFTFQALPANLSELQALPEAALTDPYATAALSLLALTRFQDSREDSIQMLNFLKGPDNCSPAELQQISDRFMDGKFYKVNSFFEGATPANNYTPAKPFRVKVSSTPHSFDNEGWATLYLHSGGSDSPRPVKLRKKPSTGQWFMVEIQYLGDVKTPVAQDKWA
ncbi:MAG: hypothetical protein J6O51_00130 [Bacteroidales bacterium]|nr:hypothetical protein [Bacteroidales bacterium]